MACYVMVVFFFLTTLPAAIFTPVPAAAAAAADCEASHPAAAAAVVAFNTRLAPNLQSFLSSLLTHLPHPSRPGFFHAPPP